MTSNSSSIAEVADPTLAKTTPDARDGLEKASDPNDKHLRTDHLLDDLKGRTVSGTVITIASQATQFLLNLASIMVMARLLTPRDFGLYAMVTTVTGFLWMFQDAGLSTATVQRQVITHAQVSNLYWINVAVGAVTTLFVGALSPAVAWFYREPRLVAITMVLSITFSLASSAVQHMALLNRQMRFAAIAMIYIVSALAGYLVGAGMALLGYGYWSLVWAAVTQSATRLLLAWVISGWRPQMPSRYTQTRHMVTFGANITGGSLLYSLARGADNLLVGRFFGAAAVGLYSRASILLIRPLEQFTIPINAVLVPALSRIQAQPERYRRTFLRVYEALALISFLFAGLMLPLAHPITLVVLGPKWEQAAPIFAGFSIAALCIPLAGASTWLFQTQGRGKDWLINSLLGSFITVASFVAGLPFGSAGVAIAYSLAGLFIGVPVLFYFAGRQGPVTTGDLWRRVICYLPLWIVVFGATWMTRLVATTLSPLMQLALCVPAGVVAGAILIWAIPSMRRIALSLVETLLELKSRIGVFNPK